MVEDREAYRRVVNSPEFIELFSAEKDCVIGILRSENQLRTARRLDIDTERAKDALERVEDEAYSLSLAMQKMLFENSAVISSGVGATITYVENLFAQHNLDFPMTWQILSTTGPQGITYRHDTPQEIEQKSDYFIEQINQGSVQARFDSFTRERLKKAANFMKTHRINLSRYHDGYYMSK